MATEIDQTGAPRLPLSKDRVLRAAITLADEGGIESLSMRKLGQALGVEAMSLYNHARNKDDILDGIVDVVIGEVEVPPSTADWKASMRRLAIAGRTVLLRHPWVPRVMESRLDPGPATMQHLESAIGILRDGGFSIDLTHHAMHVLGSRVFGFNQDLFDEPGRAAPSPEVAAILAVEMSQRYPHITELAAAVSHEGGLGGCDDDVEFEFALDLILDGLERLRDAA